MHHARALSALLLASSLTVAACGSGEDAATSKPARTIDVSMTDNAFTPSSFEVAAGEEVTFAFTNDGTVDHEAILGTEAEQADHEATMAGDDADHGTGEMEGMDHGSGSAAEAVTVEPGGTGTLERTFDRPGTVIIGCHEPGHYEAGMKATITVT